MASLSKSILNPFRWLRRRRRLEDAIREEAAALSRMHGERAHAAALEMLARGDLTTWGRKVVEGAARRLSGS